MSKKKPVRESGSVFLVQPVRDKRVMPISIRQMATYKVLSFLIKDFFSDFIRISSFLGRICINNDNDMDSVFGLFS